jgi:uncharacterized membrane protein YidH (DUF202 family)
MAAATQSTIQTAIASTTDRASQSSKDSLAISERHKDMKVATVVGIILIVLGIAGFVVGGVSFTHQKKDVDLGPVRVSHEERKTIPISPVLSVVSLVAGVGLVVVGARSKT